MNGDLNPTLPVAFDVAWMIVVLLWVVSTGIAVLSIMRARHSRWGARAWWCVFAVAVPFTGSLAWFWQHRTERRDRP